jgi:hypothetical protein
VNLHAVAGPIVAAVNPSSSATIAFSTGSAPQPGGGRTPTYSAPVPVTAQVQALTYRDLQQIEGLNLQGTRRAIYLYGDVEGIVRVTQQGGDIITFPGPIAGFPPGTVWLVAQALETWPGWCKVAATLQTS